jgi:type II secretory pathway predicted ATPase ExeA
MTLIWRDAITRLVKDGSYSALHLLEGIYAELLNGMNPSKTLFARINSRSRTNSELVGSYDPSRVKTLYLSDSKLTPRHFYKGLFKQLGCEAKFYRGDAKRQLHREVELMRDIHRLQLVVIVDGAHLLDREMLEEVQFLLNFKMNAQSPMALILVSQNELWGHLRLQAYAAIRHVRQIEVPIYWHYVTSVTT